MVASDIARVAAEHPQDRAKKGLTLPTSRDVSTLIPDRREPSASTGPPTIGPRPLALHLSTARRLWGSAGASALDRAAWRAFMKGLERYWTHPRAPVERGGEVIWACGTTSLVGHGPADGPPLLLVPSLINRAYVLDLRPDRSLMRFLAGAGYRVLLLDWGSPGPVERRMDLDRHIIDRLEAAIVAVQAADRRPLILLGYCMGGLLALAAAVRRRRRIGALALLATPWDFHAGIDIPPTLRATGAAARLVGVLGAVPVDLIQSLFAGLDPEQVPRKFGRFGRLEPGSREAHDFVAIEDWLNDGIPLAPDVWQACLEDWYVSNLPGRGMWRVGRRRIAPERLDLPTFVAIPRRDRIVPPESAEALALALPRVDVVRPTSGHITMVVGARARAELWDPLLTWLNTFAVPKSS